MIERVRDDIYMYRKQLGEYLLKLKMVSMICEGIETNKHRTKSKEKGENLN